MLDRKPEETLKDYTIRLCKNKDNHGITFMTISDLIADEFGVRKDESTYRKWWTNYNEGYEDGYTDALDEANDMDMLQKLEDAKLDIQKEKYKLFDQRNALNKLLRQQARKEEILEIIDRHLESGKLPKLVRSPFVFDYHANNDVLCSLNDLHYGANVDNNWNTYNSEICAEYLGKYLAEIFQIADTHKSENCYVWANGDLIAGNIHKTIAITNRENVIEQIMEVSELVAKFLYELSKRFKKVYFMSVSGNHSRMDYKDDALKDERLDNLIGWYVKARLQNCTNVIVNCETKIDETVYLMNIRGKNYIGIHGDYDGSVNKLQALQMMVNKPIYAVLTAHLHHNATDYVQGVKVVMAGSFLGMDDYCISKRIYGFPQQSVSICTDKGIQCTYDINFNE